MNRHSKHKEIWLFLEGKLSEPEEQILLKWIGESEKNMNFFNETIDDFNAINSPHLQVEDIKPAPVNYTNTMPANTRIWPWAAAILILLSTTLIIFQQLKKPKNSSTKSVHHLVDGIKIETYDDGQLFYSQASFERTRTVRIKGKAKISISAQANQPLVINSQSGFFMLTEGSALMGEVTNKSSDFKLIEGHALLMGLSEIELQPGDSIHHEVRQNTYIIHSDFSSI
jgi:hypothetical protein